MSTHKERSIRTIADPQPRDGGEYVVLREGVTHVRVDGPAHGTPLVLLHGATVPCWEFDVLVPHLSARGFRTLRFDLFGHGRSDRPAGDYSLERFTNQAIEVIDAVDFPRPVVLLGHSLGAAIAATVAVARRDWVTRLVLVAPMLNFNARNRLSTLLELPGAGELLMRLVGIPALVRRRRARYAHIGQPHFADWFVEQASDRGFARALASMVRTGALGDQAPRYAALRAGDPDVFVIAASGDAIVPAADIARTRELLPAHRYLEIRGAEHNLLLTHADVVASALAERQSPEWMANAARVHR